MTVKKKLIEVALPLEAINKASAREKSIRHGHPSTLHLWWARRPLAACRAVLFAQLVDDPSSHPDKFPTESAQEKERQRLFKIIEELVKWENSNNERVLEMARQEILKSCDGELPAIYDPFSGGGSIPLEAQRLGLPAYGSDLNPVAVMIGKAMIEFPPKFSGWKPVNPESRKDWTRSDYKGARGLAEDVRYYGEWMKKEAEKRIGHFYPKIKLPDGGEATIIAWIWARTVSSPDPSCNGAHVPLIRAFELSIKNGKKVFIRPLIDKSTHTYKFEICTDKGKVPDATVSRNGAMCILSGTPISLPYIRNEAKAGRMRQRLMAVVAESSKGRIYLPPSDEIERLALSSKPNNIPDTDLPLKALGFRIQEYGMLKHQHLFTNRQLLALETFSDLVQEAREQVLIDAHRAEVEDDQISLENGGDKATAYADAVAVYLAFAVDRGADGWSTIATWSNGGEFIRFTFARQALPMTWDFAECNPFSSSSGNFLGAIKWVSLSIDNLPANGHGSIVQKPAQMVNFSKCVVSSDPPYYDNIGYADLSDYFYVWLRRSLSKIFPKLLSTILVPKSEELVATPFRFGNSKNKAEDFFLTGMKEVISKISAGTNPSIPTTIYYAFKQSETSDEGITSTGWATFLEAIITSGFAVDGTWPMRTEREARSVGIGTNALASSIILVCRKRAQSASIATRAEFIQALKKELPPALKQLQFANIEPVDIPQASIGPGIGIFSRYAKVIEADGSEMSVKTALALINKAVDEIRSEQDTDYDDYTRFGVTWFEQFGLDPGPYGVAENVATARGISVQGVKEAGLIDSGSGKVRILKRHELPKDWDPLADSRLTVWEVTQHMIRILNEQGLDAAAKLFKQVGGLGASSKELAYRLFDICEKKKWAEEATVYNGLIKEWPEIETRAVVLETSGEERQTKLAL